MKIDTSPEHAARLITMALIPLDPPARVEALWQAQRIYCFDCGYPPPNEGHCVCKKDE
jgi:hypothetical protein